ncbi:hypothetical protein BH24BAC1_BH24BAC1_25960 [soil metagenome]
MILSSVAACPTGFLHGICARGGFDLNLDWENGGLKQVTLLSKLGNPCRLRYGERVISIPTQKGQTYVFDGSLKPLKEN